MAKKPYRKTGIKNITRAEPARKIPHRKPRAKQPKQGALPGHELVRDARLDELCEEIGQAREELAQAKKDEEDGIAAALERMRERKCHRYEFAKVQLTFKAGQDRVAVKVLKETTSPGGDIPSDAQKGQPSAPAPQG